MRFSRTKNELRKYFPVVWIVIKRRKNKIKFKTTRFEDYDSRISKKDVKECTTPPDPLVILFTV